MEIKKFTLKDQNNFAKLSGDYNPVHVDPILTRRTLFGSPIVHGVHGLLWALDRWLFSFKSHVTINKIKVKFYKSIKLDQEVSFFQKTIDSDEIELTLLCEGILMTKVRLSWCPKEKASRDYFYNSFPPKTLPSEPEVEEIESMVGNLDLYILKNKAQEAFPSLIEFIDLNQLSVILGTTKLVGMECPGLYSIYSELILDKHETNNLDGLGYKVLSYDGRFGLIETEINGPNILGKIISFIRPKQKEQISMKDMEIYKLSNEFLNQRAVIIGGSRGLGEVVAKLIASGGGQVRISYMHGKEDAKKVCDDLKVKDKEANFFLFDVLNPSKLGEQDFELWKPTHLYYFATPLIPQTQNSSFNQDIYRELCKYYIDGFQNTFLLFQGVVDNFFYPSTSYIDENPANFLEYVASKLKAEEVLNDLEEKNNLFIFKPRLPKMDTDQTSSLTSRVIQDATPVLLEKLKEFSNKSILNHF